MPKLLLVEDDKVVASIYQRKFAQDGFEVRLCANGQDAIAQLAEFAPDVVILDLNLPVVDGFQVLRHIRTQAAFENLPVVVFSNAYQPRLIDEAWRSGASAVLMKANTNPRKMGETIRDLLDTAIPPPATATLPPPARPATTESRPRLEGLPQFIGGLRKVHAEFLAATNDDARQTGLLSLSRAAKGLATSASAAGILDLARVADAFHHLLQELHDRPATLTVSTRRSSSRALDALSHLAAAGADHPQDTTPASVLLADGNRLSGRLAQFVFQKAGLNATLVDHAETALKAGRSARFDLIVLDSDVNGMTAVECTRQLRADPQCQTPVVIVFPLHDYARELDAVTRLGADLVAKPYSANELASLSVALIHLHRLARSHA